MFSYTKNNKCEFDRDNDSGIGDFYRSNSQLAKRFFSCTLCPKCFIHLSELQQHHDNHHVVSQHQQHQHHFHQQQHDHEQHQQHNEHFQRGKYSQVQKNQDHRKAQLLPRSRQNSQSEEKTTRGSNRSIRFDLPFYNSDESPDDTATTTTTTTSTSGETSTSSSSKQCYRCNVCLELFQTKEALKLHKTLDDHHTIVYKGKKAHNEKYRFNAKCTFLTIDNYL